MKVVAFRLLLLLTLCCSGALGQGFTPTGSMNLARTEHRAVLLPSGLVLVTGGGTPGGYTNTAELYDPKTGTWRYTKSAMNVARAHHSATLLADGRVLVAGGGNSSGSLTSCEIFDPASESFVFTGSLSMARQGHQAAALTDGRVMAIAGGSSAAPCCAVASAEVYNPSTGTWAWTAPVPTFGPGTISPGYTNHAVTLLPDGKVFMTGGYDGYTLAVSSAVLRYDPAANTWQVLSPMNSPRNQHTATTLLDGKVLIVAGRLPSSLASFTSTEIYDPAALPNGISTPGAPLAGVGRANHAATLLGDGRVLVTGGAEYVGSGCCYIGNSSAQLFAPAAGTWTEVGPMTSARAFHTATRLPSGAVLIAGGFSQDLGWGNTTVLSSAELWGASITVAIDIKPGSYPNTINLGSGGTVPVAIFSTASFDARTVDPLSVTLASAPVRLKGNGTPMSSAEDVNGDGNLDLVVHVTTQALQLSETDTEAILTGHTFDGKTIQGRDTIRVLP